MKRKMIPLMLMLFAGAITSIIMYIFQYDMKSTLMILLAVLFCFYIIGLIIKRILDSFEKQLEEIRDEGEVIEKETSEQKEENAEEDKN